MPVTTPQFMNQRQGVVFTVLLAGIGTFILLKLVNTMVGLRVAQDEKPWVLISVNTVKRRITIKGKEQTFEKDRSDYQTLQTQ